MNCNIFSNILNHVTKNKYMDDTLYSSTFFTTIINEPKLSINEKDEIRMIYLLTKLFNNTSKTIWKKSQDSQYYSKLKIYQHFIIDNFFISQEIKDQMITYFRKAQKNYFALCKFKLILKINCKKELITTDLYGDELNAKDKKTLILIHKNNKYLFSIYDLKNILIKNLSNHDEFFLELLECKNPYNNVKFTSYELYNIYFKMKDLQMIIPELINGFFLSEWSLDVFHNRYEILIREKAILHHINTENVENLYSDIVDMIHQFVPSRFKFKLNPHYPHNKLVKIMKPYLILYYRWSYGVAGANYRQDAINILKKKLISFIKYNPNFGKKIDNPFIKNVNYDDKHINFYNEQEIDKKNNKNDNNNNNNDDNNNDDNNNNNNNIDDNYEDNDIQYDNFNNYDNNEDTHPIPVYNSASHIRFPDEVENDPHDDVPPLLQRNIGSHNIPSLTLQDPYSNYNTSNYNTSNYNISLSQLLHNRNYQNMHIHERSEIDYDSTRYVPDFIPIINTSMTSISRLYEEYRNNETPTSESPFSFPRNEEHNPPPSIQRMYRSDPDTFSDDNVTPRCLLPEVESENINDNRYDSDDSDDSDDSNNRHDSNVDEE